MDMENEGYIRALLARFQAADTAPAFLLYDGQQLTQISYRRFAGDILCAAGWLRANGLAGQHIALIRPNSYEWLVAFLAIGACGGTPVLLDPELPGETLGQQCAHTDTAAVCGGERLPEAWLASGVRRLPWPLPRAGAPLRGADLPRPEPEATAVLLFTSGTAGKSKAVELSFRNVACCISSPDGGFSAPDMEKSILALPLHHIAGLRSSLDMLFRQKTLCIGRGSRYLLTEMPLFNPTHVLLVPAMAESMARLLKNTETAAQRQKYLGTTLRRIGIGGASVRREVCLYWMGLGYTVESGYAMTETAGVGTWAEWDSAHLNTIGRPWGETQCRVENGELLLKGPSVMKGYYKDPAETARVLRDGWMHTGDLGRCDADGYYYLTGRRKNTIILSNGENVSPEEVEAQLAGCDAVLECLVYSDGKGICADIYTAQADWCAAFIRQYNAAMPLYRQIRKVNYSAQPLPKTGSGKVRRKECADV